MASDATLIPHRKFIRCMRTGCRKLIGVALSDNSLPGILCSVECVRIMMRNDVVSLDDQMKAAMADITDARQPDNDPEGAQRLD